MKFYTTSKISENMHETPEGYLVCVGVSIGRTGEMTYGPGETPLEVGPDGVVLVTRDAKEVFRPETIASFEGKAITLAHPTEFVSPINWSVLTKGVLQNIRKGTGEQESDLVADLLITDAEAIAAVKAGLREVSSGYEAEYTQTGVGRGFQTNIVGNHLALVDEGRAGSSYAINDHKGKGSKMKVGDKLKAIFGKAVDEAIKTAEEPVKDAPVVEPSGAYDEITKMVKDLGAKIDAMAKPVAKDAPAVPASAAVPPPTTGDEEVAPSLEARLKALEDRVAKMESGQTGDDADEDDDSDETGDEEGCDDDFDESTMTGDAKTVDAGPQSDLASRVEIMAPGMDPKQKNVKAKALIAAFATTDGKAEISKFTGGKLPDVKNAATVDMLFIAVSEGLKASRTSSFAKTRTRTRDFDSTASEDEMTPEKLNELNAKAYPAKTTH